MYWLEQALSDVPAEDEWLHPNEVVRLGGMRFARRREDWRLGRWTAKRAVTAYLDRPPAPEVLAEFEIRAGTSGAPQVFVANQAAPLTISISHRSGIGLCAISGAGGESGCDLETVEDRGSSFLGDYFTLQEQNLVAIAPASEHARIVTVLWSAKESVLKALRLGLTIDTRSAVVTLESAFTGDCRSWRRLRACCSGRQFRGWWRESDGFVRTIVAAREPGPPRELAL
jgi:4'-phosphopantetheinyl transferase